MLRCTKINACWLRYYISVKIIKWTVLKKLSCQKIKLAKAMASSFIIRTRIRQTYYGEKMTPNIQYFRIKQQWRWMGEAKVCLRLQGKKALGQPPEFSGSLSLSLPGVVFGKPLLLGRGLGGRKSCASLCCLPGGSALVLPAVNFCFWKQAFLSFLFHRIQNCLS